MNGPDSATFIPWALKTSVCVPMSPVMVRPENETTPPAAVAVALTIVPPPLAIAAVTVSVDVVTRLSASSRISSIGCVRSAAPDAAPVGSVMTTSLAGAPGPTSNPADVTAGNPVAVKVSVRSPIAPLTESPLKVTTPPLPVAVDPLREPPPVAITAVIVAVSPVATFPAAS